MRRWFALLGMSLWLDCHNPLIIAERSALPADEVVATKDTLTVSLRIVAPTDFGERLLIDGELLHNGDQLALLVWTSQSAYLNVVKLSIDGRANALFPVDKFQRTPGHCAVRIPSRGWLYLRAPAGPENLRVVASLRPLAEADFRMCQALQLHCAVGTEPAKTLLCAEPLTQNATSHGKRAVNPLIKYAVDEGNGVASIAVILQHVP